MAPDSWPIKWLRSRWLGLVIAVSPNLLEVNADVDVKDDNGHILLSFAIGAVGTWQNIQFKEAIIKELFATGATVEQHH